MCEPVISYIFISAQTTLLNVFIPVSQTLPSAHWMMWVKVNCDETTPCSLPPTVLFQNKGMFLWLVLPIYVFSTKSLHIVLKSLSACVCLGLRGDLCGGCWPWIQLCLSEKYLAVSEGKPEPQEGQYGPRDPANRKLTPTLVHLPNIHRLEISPLFFIEVSLLFNFLTFRLGKILLSKHTSFQAFPSPV